MTPQGHRTELQFYGEFKELTKDEEKKKQNNNKNNSEKFRILSKIKKNFPKKRNFFSLFPPNERIIFGREH